jgi:hypothetical protein
MTTQQKTSKRPGLGAALVASITSEKASIEDRFARADSLFEDKDKGQQEDNPVHHKEIRKGSPKADTPVPETTKPVPKQPAPIQEKVKRDTFSFPLSDYKRISEIQKDALLSAIQINKSEVVRAGLMALQSLSPDKRHKLLLSVEKIKPGRPV